MKKLILFSITLLLLSMNFALAQNLPPTSSIQVNILSSYSYKAADGTTVVLGEVQNLQSSPITSVNIGITFMDDNSRNIEYKTGTTLLQVIPPGGKVPFSISSTKPDPTITQVQVKLAGFKSSSDRPQVLEISPSPLQITDKLVLSGMITNNGLQNSTNTKLYLISYDAFERVVGVGVSDSINVESGKSSQFGIISDASSRAKSYMIIAESDNYQSKPTIVQNALPVAVGNTIVTDSNDKSYSTIPVNATTKITSTLNYPLNSTQSFIYYVQVKKFSGQTDFIGKYEGVFLGSGKQNVSVNWSPHLPGSYFIETFVWNYDAVPLAAQVSSINVVLVK